MLSAYYQGGYAVVHPLGADGAMGAPSLDSLTTAMGAHAIQTDPSRHVILQAKLDGSLAVRST
jgi:hypothetical protein